MNRARIRTWASEAHSPEVAIFLDRVSMLPDAVAVAVMPDVHLAPPACVGTVVATTDYLYPELLGSDLGCGLAAVPLGVDATSIADPGLCRDLLRSLIRVVPVTKRERAYEGALVESGSDLVRRLVAREGRFELGTLGRGNHFLEIQEADDGELWLVVHSGSRAIGPAIQRAHLATATERRRGFRAIPVASDRGRAYASDVETALAFAARNRSTIVEAALEAIGESLTIAPDDERRIDCQHDSVTFEMHDVGAVWVHRKGAMALPPGARGVVPGSMGTETFVVVGRDEPGSLRSSAHGAGRAVPRGEARRRFDGPSLAEAMDRIVFDQSKLDRLRDESPRAYKDVRSVMRAQRALVSIEATLRPRIVHKGA